MGRFYRGELRWQEDVPRPYRPDGLSSNPGYVLEAWAVGTGDRVWGQTGGFVDAMWPLVRFGCEFEPLVVQLGSGKHRPVDEESWAKVIKQLGSARRSNRVMVDAAVTAKYSYRGGSTAGGGMWLQPQEERGGEGTSRWHP